MDINWIIDAIHSKQLRITDHADEEAEADGVSYDEIYASVLNGEIIEDYPDDKPYPSCLIFGRTLAGNPIHSVWAYNSENDWAVLVTVYKPDPSRWIDWKWRKKDETI